MKQLEQNIINIFGEDGKKWIADLPAIITELATYWELEQLTPVNNMTFHYVAKAMARTNQPVVLKIGCDEKNFSHEIQALQHFNGNGSIRLISHHSAHHALLLQQAIPGITLTSLYPTKIDYVMDCYINTMKRLHANSLTAKNNDRHIKDWLTAIDSMQSPICPENLIKKAITLKNKLLTSMKTEVFLHGDLHHDNILLNENEWLAIDPKGIIGEPAFEIAAFDFMYIHELANDKNIKPIVESRINLLAQKSNLDPQRIKDWVFVRLILMAAWFIEDNGDPSWAIQLAKKLEE